MHFWCNTSIKPANRKKEPKTKPKLYIKQYFHPATEALMQLLKKNTKINKQKKTKQKKNNPERIFKNPLKLTYNLGYSYIRYSVIH